VYSIKKYQHLEKKQVLGELGIATNETKNRDKTHYYGGDFRSNTLLIVTDKPVMRS